MCDVLCCAAQVPEAILLKPNMCLPGLDAPTASPAEVAKYTTRTMLRT
jgi:fructose-bisphosphate aldolase class I